MLAERGGELVTATAGHNMEAMLAAYGSGAAQASYDGGLRILNVDIGGGTTKLALLDRGRVLATAAVHVGGRLQVVDDDGRIVRLDPAGQEHAVAGRLRLGARGRRHGRRRSSRSPRPMADTLVAAITADPLPDRRRAALPDRPAGPAGRHRRRDVLRRGRGVRLPARGPSRSATSAGRSAGAVRRRIDSGALPFPLLPAGECIRATALGASEYSVQLSGNTGWISDPDALLPRRNLQVLRPVYELGRRRRRGDRGDRHPPAPRRPGRRPRRRGPRAGDVVARACRATGGCSRSPAGSATGWPTASPRAARST